MPGLALKLAPREQVLINGVVVENGPRRTQIVIMTEDAAVLRMREALAPQDVIGPASRAYFNAQQALSGVFGEQEGSDTVVKNLSSLAEVSHDEGFLKSIRSALEACNSGNFYRVMRCLKPIVEAEKAAATSQS